ncbi:MAG: winged helix-turn-helix transcriptional regulator [Candidatus Pacearchaeota archaeon]|nr:MAG: winged helix-turn-helix transcriptional regulator [Candidatus Pacearchaeota archaeon]
MIKAKGMIGIIAFIFLFTILLTQAQAATVYGSIYGPDLELAIKTIVEINSTPKQSIVAHDGTYSFTVPEGTYEIEAFYSTQGILLYDKETITLPAEGNFVLDLILFETLDIEELEFDESELKMIEDLLKERSKVNIWLIIGIIIAITIIGFIIYLISRKSKSKKKIKKRKKKRKVKEKIKPVGDEVMTAVLKILKREKRVTQKAIRKELGISEAKASLVIADLEDQGKVKKIKRGRGNIIIYKG